jgi:hypothetical protein
MYLLIFLFIIRLTIKINVDEWDILREIFVMY